MTGPAPAAPAATAVRAGHDDTADEPADALLQRLEWTVLRRLDGLLQGDHRTLWRGSGIDLADLREYQPGDDARHIDWHATARLQQPQVRQYTEDREMTAWFLVDMSPSMAFGSARHSKLSAARAMLGGLARLLTRHGNAVGALLYRPVGLDARSAQPMAGAGALARAPGPAAAGRAGGRSGACQVLPARTGRPQVLQLLRALQAGAGPVAPAATAATAAATRHPAATAWWRGRRGWPRRAAAPATPPGDATRLDLLLHQAEGLLRRRVQVLVVSDFISQPGWQAPLARLARHHDVLAVRLVDPAERQLPALGLVTVQDAETGEQVLVDCSDPGFRQRFAQAVAAQDEALDRAFAEAGVDQFELATDEPLLPALMRCTALRRQRLGQPLPRLLPADGRPQAAVTAAATPAFAPPSAA